MVGYLRAFGWRLAWIVAARAVLRGSYDLYQGFEAFVRNAMMGVILMLLFLRRGRGMPVLVARPARHRRVRGLHAVHRRLAEVALSQGQWRTGLRDMLLRS